MNENLRPVLTWVNEQRAKHSIGKPLDELPQGRVGDACKCPLALCFGTDAAHASVTRSNTKLHDCSTHPDDCVVIEHPSFIDEFIRVFDEGGYPSLLADAEEEF